MACAVVMTGLPGTTTPNGVACCAGSCCILRCGVFIVYLKIQFLFRIVSSLLKTP
jgi:hypothetical protein